MNLFNVEAKCVLCDWKMIDILSIEVGVDKGALAYVCINRYSRWSPM